MTCIIRRNNPVHTPLFLLNTNSDMTSSHTTFHFWKSNGGNTSRLLYRRRFINSYKRTIPSFTLLAGYKSQRRLLFDSIRHIRNPAQSFSHRAQSREDFTFRSTFHPHIHTDIILIRHLYSKRCFNIFGGLGTFLVKQIRIGIYMCPSKSQFLRWLKKQATPVSSSQVHGLSHIMIKIIMHFISSLHFPATENIDIISVLFSCSHNTHHTVLISL